MSDLISGLPQVRPFEQKDRDALNHAAAEDHHKVISPTVVIEKRGEIVGYGSFIPCVMVNTWLHSKKLNSRESFHMLNMGENLARNMTGQRIVLMPCSEDSPFYEMMESFGYKRLGTTSLNVKG